MYSRANKEWRLQMKLEIEVDLPTATPAELAKHVWWALTQYQTRGGARLDVTEVKNLGAYNYKFTGREPPGADGV